MNLKRIFDEHEEAQRRKREAADKLREAQLTLRASNAQKVETHLRDVVEPVLEEAKRQLATAGYPAKVETIQRKDESLGQRVTFALGLRLELTPSKSTLSWHIEYIGDFASTSLRVEQRTHVNFVSQTKVVIDSKPVEEFTREFVDQQIERFVEAAFKTGS